MLSRVEHLFEPVRPPRFHTNEAGVSLQACLKDRLPGNPDGEAVGKCVEELTSAIQKAPVSIAPKRPTHAYPRSALPAITQDEIRLNNRVKRK